MTTGEDIFTSCPGFEQKMDSILARLRGSRKLVVAIVAVAILLDNMLLTAVVPIIPAYLYEIHHEKNEIARNKTKQHTIAKDYYLNSNTGSTSELPMFISFNKSETDKQKCIEGPKVCKSGNLTKSQNETEKDQRHEDIVHESLEVGILFASKPVIQAIINPFIGALTNKLIFTNLFKLENVDEQLNRAIGYSLPMFAGFVIMFVSTLIFAIGKSYITLLIARALQGVGSACTSVAGMGMLADRYTDDRERGNAMAIALGGLALGVLIGPPFGGIMYEFFGKSSPFFVLSLLALFDGLLQLFVLQPKISKEPKEGASLLTLIKDPYILVAAGAITFANTGIGILEPSLPLWMMDTMNANNWEQGAAFLPPSISYLVSTNLFGPLGHMMGRWLAAMIGLTAIGFALLSIPMAKSLDQLILPNGIIGLAIGMVDSSMMPMLGYLVDTRYTSIYGNVYAIGDVAFCFAFIIGPLLSGTIINWIGFEGLVTITSLICFIFAPFMLLLRKPPPLKENQFLLEDATVKYINYTNELSPEEDDIPKKPFGPPLLP